jgi:hypothetical protein
MQSDWPFSHESRTYQGQFPHSLLIIFNRIIGMSQPFSLHITVRPRDLVCDHTQNVDVYVCVCFGFLVVVVLKTLSLCDSGCSCCSMWPQEPLPFSTTEQSLRTGACRGTRWPRRCEVGWRWPNEGGENFEQAEEQVAISALMKRKKLVQHRP